MGKDSTESHRPGDRNAFSLGQPAVKIEHQMVLLLRKQEGFLDQLILLSGSGETIYVYSFWDNSEDAEKYDSHSWRAPKDEGQHNAAKVN